MVVSRTSVRVVVPLVLAVATLTLAAALSGPRSPRTADRRRDTPPRSEAAAHALAAYGRLPLRFEPNRGQAASDVKYLTRAERYTVFLTERSAVFAFKGNTPGTAAAIKLTFADADRAPRRAAGTALPGRSHYLKGSAASWRTNVPQYADVRYEAVYPGVDVVFHGRQRAFEYDFVVAPGADPRAIRLAIAGAETIRLDGGDLVLQAGGVELRQRKPEIYQDSPAGRQTIDGSYQLLPDGAVGFEIAAYDASRPLTIDPVVVYSSYLGGGSSGIFGGDQGWSIAVDADGAAYLTGMAWAADFPVTPGAVQTTRSGESDAFVAKVSPDGSTLLYSTVLGGSSHENYFVGGAVAVDGAGNAYVTGETLSDDFPTTPGAFRRTGGTVFAAKINPSGSALVYSTLIGNGRGHAIAVDAFGQAYLTGLRHDRAFPTRNPLMATLADHGAFVLKLNASGSDLVFSTYLGGSAGFGESEFDEDQGTAIAVDPAGHVYVGGRALSRDFPVVNAAQPQHGGATLDAFVARIDASGQFLHFLTYLGGSGRDMVTGIAVGLDFTVHVAGATASANFPSVNPLPVGPPDLLDAFVTRLSATGSAILFSTRIGGPNLDSAGGIALDQQGAIFVVGSTDGGFPQVRPLPPAFGTALGGDAFVMKLARGGSPILYSTYLGGDGLEWGAGIALDRAGSAYVTGSTFMLGSTGTFPIVGGFQPVAGGGIDAYVAKIVDDSGTCPDEITSRVLVTRFGQQRLFLTPVLFEWVVLTNVSPDPIAGPLALAVTDLQNAAYIGSSRTTTCLGEPRTPYGVVPIFGDAVLAPGESALTGVWLYQSQAGAVTYSTRVLSAVPLQ